MGERGSRGSWEEGQVERQREMSDRKVLFFI